MFLILRKGATKSGKRSKAIHFSTSQVKLKFSKTSQRKETSGQ